MLITLRASLALIRVRDAARQIEEAAGDLRNLGDRLGSVATVAEEAAARLIAAIEAAENGSRQREE